jgi:hypothetical protein
MRDQAQRLLERGPGAVLLKGGHGSDDEVIDILATADGQVREFTHPRVTTMNTHGTGCTLSAAITAEVAVLGRERAAIGADLLGVAVGNALDYLARASELGCGLAAEPGSGGRARTRRPPSRHCPRSTQPDQHRSFLPARFVGPVSTRLTRTDTSHEPPRHTSTKEFP